MESSTPKTPAELAEEAGQARDDAVTAAQGYAAESVAIGRSAAQSVRSDVEDAMATGAQALDTAKGITGDALDTGRAYAQGAVDAAGKKIGTVRFDLQELKEKGCQYIVDEPVRSIVYAAIGSALLTALLLAMRRGRRDWR